MVVTGGAQGLGFVCARALLEHGVTALAIFDIESEQLKAAIEHLKPVAQTEVNIIARKVDVTDDATVHLAVTEVSKDLGGIDILLCFAGITGSELSIEYGIERWRKIVDVNLNGSFIVARNVARYSTCHNCSLLYLCLRTVDFKADD